MTNAKQPEDILVVGSIGFDDIETPFGRAEHVLGGSTVYFTAAASLFAPVNVVSVVGTDMPLDQFDFLRERGADLTGLQVADGKTFHWAGRYNYDMNTRDTLITELNVYADFHPGLPSAYEDTPFVFLANIHPDLQREVLNQIKRPRLTMMDTMNLWIEIERDSLIETMRRVDMVCMNEEEARELSGSGSLVTASRYILGLGPRVVLIKKGENGCVMITPEGYFMTPAYPLEEVHDPTGAGDSFAGGFMGYLAANGTLNDDALRRAVVYGSAVASFTVEKFSVDRLRHLTRREIDERYTDFRRFTFFEAL
jgi:sugar/nucleoside kinase (ribokinase family)